VDSELRGRRAIAPNASDAITRLRHFRLVSHDPSRITAVAQLRNTRPFTSDTTAAIA